MKSLDELEKELCLKKSQLKIYENRKLYSKEKMELKKRELRDQVRYIIGGLILDNNYCQDFVNLKNRIFDDALTRDKRKLVEIGFCEGDLEGLIHLNINECKESAKKAGIDTEFTPEEEDQITHILRKSGYQKVYGKKNELYVYTGPKVKFFISNNVAKYLLEKENFFT
jgi:hypothetical protein